MPNRAYPVFLKYSSCIWKQAFLPFSTKCVYLEAFPGEEVDLLVALRGRVQRLKTKMYLPKISWPQRYKQQQKEATATKNNNKQQQKRSNNNNKCSPPCSQRQTGLCPACRKQWADPSGPAKSENRDHLLLFHFMVSQRNFTNGSWTWPRRCFLYITMTNTITSHLVVLVGKAEPLVKGDRAIPVLVDGLEHVSRASLHSQQSNQIFAG